MKDKKGKFNKLSMICIGMLIAAMLIPLGMDHFIIGNNIPSNINNESWVSFFGGYLGAIITGVATFVAFYFTFKRF